MGGGGDMQPLVDVAGWLSLIGWFNIILGGLQCVTIIYAVIGWLPLWLGFLMKNAADKLKSGQHQAAAKDLSTVITIAGVITLIYIIFLAIMAVVFLIFIIFAMIAAAANG